MDVLRTETAPLYSFCFDGTPCFYPFFRANKLSLRSSVLCFFCEALMHPIRFPWLTDFDILRFSDVDKAFHDIVTHIAGQLTTLDDPTQYIELAGAWIFLAAFMSWVKFIVNALYFLMSMLNRNGDWDSAAVYKDVASRIDHDDVKEGSLKRKQNEEMAATERDKDNEESEESGFSKAEIKELKEILKERRKPAVADRSKSATSSSSTIAV